MIGDSCDLYAGFWSKTRSGNPDQRQMQQHPNQGGTQSIQVIELCAAVRLADHHVISAENRTPSPKWESKDSNNVLLVRLPGFRQLRVIGMLLTHSGTGPVA